MGVRIEWAEVHELHLVTDPEDCTDEHGTTLSPGHVGIAAPGVVVEGKPVEVAARLRELADEADALTGGQP